MFLSKHVIRPGLRVGIMRKTTLKINAAGSFMVDSEPWISEPSRRADGSEYVDRSIAVALSFAVICRVYHI